MNIIFSKCADAINQSLSSNGYGIFYSGKGVDENSIHVHECCEILFCLHGGENFLIGNNIYNVEDGNIFIINQFEPHKITFKEGEKFERYVFQIHPSFIYNHSTDISDLSLCFYTRNTPASNKIKLKGKQVDYMLTLVEKLRKDYPFGDDIIKNNTITEMLAFVNARFIEAAKYDDVPVNESNKIIRDAIKFINQKYSEDLRLADIAANSYISVNHLCALFKKSLGTTVLKYIISKRISEAKKMLKSGKSISETAALCGFNDYANFIRTFKNIVGISPGKYNTDKK